MSNIEHRDSAVKSAGVPGLWKRRTLPPVGWQTDGIATAGTRPYERHRDIRPSDPPEQGDGLRWPEYDPFRGVGANNGRPSGEYTHAGPALKVRGWMYEARKVDTYRQPK